MKVINGKIMHEYSTPVHSINIDFSHSSEAKALLEVLSARINPMPQSEEYIDSVCAQLENAVELLESLEEQ